MEIPRRNNQVIINKNGGIVSHAVNLRFQHFPNIIERIFSCPVHLRNASERIWILHMFLRLCKDFTSIEIVHHGFTREFLSHMRSHVLNLRHERFNTSVKCIKRQRSDFVGPPAEFPSLDYAPHTIARHELGAVEQCQSLFRLQGYRLMTKLLKHTRR